MTGKHTLAVVRNLGAQRRPLTRCLSHSEECLSAYDSYGDGLDDPTEATLRITPVVIDSEERMAKIDDIAVA